MKCLFATIAVLTVLAAFAFGQLNDISIIPKPSSVDLAGDNSTFKVDRSTLLLLNRKNDDSQFVKLFNGYVRSNYGFALKPRSRKSEVQKGIFLFPNIDATRFPSGSYEIRVGKDNLVLAASDDAGKFYALQTLFQLFRHEGKDISIPAVRIKDSPRFSYRGMHLDVSRHFQPVEFIKKFIDQMAQYKFNYFHWHLTDDQGWRIEIKKYPKLTEIGSKRPESHEGPYSTTFKGDGRPVEGFYTQEQIKEVVKYAKERYITVIPEIELPGHASAALAAYPELGKGCAAPDYKFEVKKTWGIFKEVFCPTEETFKFLEDVLDETIKLFPDSPYIHLGGDEVLKDYWK